MTLFPQAEAVFCAYEPLIYPTIFDKYKANPQYYVPIAFRLNNSQHITEVARKFKQIYFGGKDPSSSRINQWVQYQSDSIFNFGIDRTTRYIAAKGYPLYYYTFSKTGTLNVLKNFAGLRSYPGAMHADVKITF